MTREATVLLVVILAASTPALGKAGERLDGVSPSIGAAGRESEAVLRWQDCVREALTNNPVLQVARHEQDHESARERSVDAGRLPQVSGRAGGGVSGSDSSAPNRNYSYGLRVHQLVYDGGRQQAGTLMAQRRISSSGIRYEAASAEERARLRSAFVGMLQAQEGIGLAAGILERRKQTTRLVELRYDAGREHRGSLLTAQARETQARAGVARAKRELRISQRRLVRSLGSRRNDRVRAAGKIGTATPAAEMPDMETIARRVPAVRNAALGTEIAELELRRARGNRMPGVQVVGGVDRGAGNEGSESTGWSADLSLSIPIWLGGAVRADVVAAVYTLRAREEDERSVRDAVVTGLLERWSEWWNAAEHVEVQRKFLEAAEERSRIAEAQYSAGQIGFDSWIIIEDEYVSAQTSLLSAEAGAMRAEAEWILATGGMLEDEVR